MVVKITQTTSGVKQLFDIECGEFCFEGKAGHINRFQNITLSGKNTEIKGVHEISPWFNYIPFRWLFGVENVTRVFRLHKNDKNFGRIALSKHGFLKSFFVISSENNEELHCYCRSKGSFNYISVYKGSVQIALIETYLNTSDFKYFHKLYILDEYAEYAEILSFFVMYYACFNFIGKGMTNYEKSYSISKYNDKYDPKWRENNFPDENFFGKINLLE